MEYSIDKMDELASLRSKIDENLLNGESDDQLRALIRQFAANYFPFAIGRDHRNVWWRARKCDPAIGKFDHVRDVIYPVGGVSEHRRASLPGSEVFYAGWNGGVALDEIRTKQGDMVQLTTFRIVKGREIPAFPIGEIHSHYASGHPRHYRGLERVLEVEVRENRPQYEYSAFVDAALAAWFAERVSESQNYIYKITALFSEILHKANGLILYPSTQLMGAWNMATNGKTFDEHFEVLDTTAFFVERKFGFGRYALQPLGQSSTFLEDGTIDWDADYNLQASYNMQDGVQFDPDYKGWRKNKD